MIKGSRFNIILAVLISCFLLSCQGDDAQDMKKEMEKVADSAKIEVSKTIKLTKGTEQITQNWLAYITMHAEMQRFRESGVEEVMNTAETTLEIIENLRKEVPEKFRIKPVNARINVLVTLGHILHQKSMTREPDKKEIKQIAEKIVVAFNNLKIQLNEATIDPLKGFELIDKQPDTLKPKLVPLKKNGRFPLNLKGDTKKDSKPVLKKATLPKKSLKKKIKPVQSGKTLPNIKKIGDTLS